MHVFSIYLKFYLKNKFKFFTENKIAAKCIIYGRKIYKHFPKAHYGSHYYN